MAQAEILKRFLVGLDLQVEKKGEEQLKSTVREATAQGVLLGEGFVGAAKAIAEAAKSIAQGFEEIFYASKRIKDSAGNIESVTYALGQLGDTQENAQKSLENFGRELRDNPQKKSILEALGITVEGRPTTEVFKDFLGRIAQLSPNIAMQRAAQFGIDEKTRFAGANEGSVNAWQKRWQEMSRKIGFDADSAAANGVKFMQSLRDAWMVFDQIMRQVVSKLQDSGIIDTFTAFLQQNAKPLADALSNIALAVVGIGKAILECLPAFDKVISATVGWKVAIAGLLIAMTGLVPILVRVLAFLTSIALSAAGAVILPIVTGAAVLGSAAIAGITALTSGSTSLNGGENEFGRRQISQIPGAVSLGNGKWSVKGANGRSVVDEKDWQGPVQNVSAGDAGVSAHGQQLSKLVTASGKSVTVNAAHAENFGGFIKELEARGYNIKDIGGYNDRANRNNPSKLSEHAFGNAIDINPAQNPNASSLITDFPADIADIAHRHGLKWGGEFLRKKDTMHFEYNAAYDRKRRAGGLPGLQPIDPNAFKTSPLGHTSSNAFHHTAVAMNQKTDIIVQGSTPEQPSLSDKYKIQHRDSTLLRNTKGALA